MSNQLAHSHRVTQPTSYAMMTTTADIFTPEGVRQSTPTSATIITTPPTFAGIVSATAQTDGSFLVTWAAATGINPPLEYLVYIALGSVSGATLFQASNVVTVVPTGALSKRVFTLSDQSTYLVKGQQYTMGVRAKDGVQNTDANLVTIVETAIASGDIPTIYQTIASDLQATEALLAADHVDFQSDHLDFVSDHTAFQGDHTNLNQDHVNLNQDHVNLNQDHLNLAQDHVDISGDHVDLQADHANFVSDHADFALDHTNLNQDHVNLNQDHLNLASDIVDLAAENVTFAASNTDFTGEIATMAGLNSQLEANIAAAAGLGGIEMEVLDNDKIQMEVVDLSEVL